MTHPDPTRGEKNSHDRNRTVRTIDSAELLQGEREVAIRHGKETYRLRLTRQGKLILHK